MVEVDRVGGVVNGDVAEAELGVGVAGALAELRKMACQ